jgi:hypothetical protein
LLIGRGGFQNGISQNGERAFSGFDGRLSGGLFF